MAFDTMPKNTKTQNTPKPINSAKKAESKTNLATKKLQTEPMIPTPIKNPLRKSKILGKSSLKRSSSGLVNDPLHPPKQRRQDTHK